MYNCHDTDTQLSDKTLRVVTARGKTAQTLHGEQDEESDHQTEQPHGLGQSEPQDGVGEQLLLQRRVPEWGTESTRTLVKYFTRWSERGSADHLHNTYEHTAIRVHTDSS